MELDHIFFFVADEAEARERMARDGLRVNYSRKHPGQGTQNLCACLDDAFLELIWLDGSPIRAAAEAIGLAARGRGEALPLGIAWRGEAPFATVPYAPPYMPIDRPIAVAKASLDPDMPLVFASPGGVAPVQRIDGLAGDRQTPALSRLGRCRLRLPQAERASALLAPFDRFDLQEGQFRLEMDLLGPAGNAAQTVVWD